MKVLIIAFDGLAYSKIKEYDCKNIMQEEFGEIDLSDFAELKTPELWASFITGTTPENHGVRGFWKWNNERFQRLMANLNRFAPFKKTKGLRTALLTSINSLDLKKKYYNKDDLETDTIFDLSGKSVSIEVPAYDDYTFLMKWGDLFKLENSIFDTAPKEVNKDFLYRKKELFDYLDNPDWQLLMCHFHKPDAYQHLYFTDAEKIKELYAEMDELAKNIKEQAPENCLIIFASDHGLEGGEHSRDAFYSINTSLEITNPKMQDFYSIIKEELQK